MNTTAIRASVATLAIAATVLTPSVAEAGSDDNLRSGACSGIADWKMQAGPQNGRVEVEFEVDANVRGQRWNVAIFHGDRRVMRTQRTTGVRSGSFTVRLVENNRAGGADRFRARAVRVGGGQRCVGRVSF
jgi:hypothetical protein